VNGFIVQNRAFDAAILSKIIEWHYQGGQRARTRVLAAKLPTDHYYDDSEEVLHSINFRSRLFHIGLLIQICFEAVRVAEVWVPEICK
jgi:hypothetical protein